MTDISTAGQRITKQNPGVSRKSSGSIQILLDAELKDLGIFERICLMVSCCATFDRARSYLYLRENSIETNVALSVCCGHCFNFDMVNVNYFGEFPFYSLLNKCNNYIFNMDINIKQIVNHMKSLVVAWSPPNSKSSTMDASYVASMLTVAQGKS